MSLLINKIMEICLKITGLWPYEFNYVGPLALLSALVTTVPFQCWKALRLKENPILLMDSLNEILPEVLIFIKLFIMWANKRNIQDLIREINDDWNRKVMPKKWKKLARYCDIFCKFEIVLYMSVILFYYSDLISKYVNKPPETRKLLFQSHYPFEYHRSPNFELLLLMQIIQGIPMVGVDTLSKSLLIAYVLHITARVHLLRCHIENYSENCSDANNKFNNRTSYLIRIISEHLNILNLVHKVDDAYSSISLFQVVFSNVTICVTGFVIITALESANIILVLKFVIFIMAMFSQAFTFCIAGQYLRDNGETITQMIYNTYWYNGKPEEIKTIIFIIANTQNSLTLSGGKLFNLSINIFAQILKTSFSYLSVLRAVFA